MSNEETKIKSDLRAAIDTFCRWRVRNDLCQPDECDFCEVNRTYDMARDDPVAEDDDE